MSHSRAIDELDAGDFAAACAGKVSGARNLDELLGDRELDAFVVLSSIASVWGSGGSGAYAAASAYLDGLAARRRARGLAATAVAFGPWAEVGMATRGETADQLSRRGLRMLPPKSAAAALGAAVGGGQELEVVADVDWSRFAPLYSSARAWPLLAGIPAAHEAVTGSTEDLGGGTQLREELAGLSVPDRDLRLTTLVRTTAATVLGHGAGSTVPAEKAFRDLGFDSLTAVELRNALNAATGLQLGATLVFDYPTPAVLAGHLAEQFAGADLGGAGSLLAELDRIEESIGSADVGAEEQAAVAARLQRMLARWTSQVSAGPAASLTEELESATSDDIFDLIDKRFGTS